MWSKFTELNFNKLKSIKKNYISLNCLYFKKINEQLETIKLQPLITNYTIKKKKIDECKLIDLVSSPWVYKKLLNNINNLDSEYLINWNNNKIYIKCTQDKFIKIEKRFPYLLRVINFIKNNNKENVVIYLLLSTLKKKCDDHKIIKPKHINSGYTDNINKYIFIWREEEFEKVLFHELIHFYNYDHRKEIYKNLKYEYLFEAITDFKAINYNLIYLSLITDIKLQDLIDFEFSFIYNQAIMINNLINKNIKLVSPAYSYYVLKYMLLKYIITQEFLEIEYNDLFTCNKNFNNIINKFQEINETQYLDFNSCRMTFFELN